MKERGEESSVEYDILMKIERSPGRGNERFQNKVSMLRGRGFFAEN